MYFEHDVVLARVLDHLQAEFLVRAYFSYGRMIDLEGFDLLDEISDVPADVDHIANAQRTGLEPDYCDCQLAVIVSHEGEYRYRPEGSSRCY